MKPQHLLIVCLSIAAAVLCAPPSMAQSALPLTAPTTATTTTGTPPKPLLWKACDVDNCLYLLGSFHVLKADDYPLSSDVDQSFAKTRRVVFEISPAEMQDKAALGAAMMQAGIRKDGSLLDSDLTPAQKVKLDGWIARNGGQLAAIGMNGDMLCMLQPWLASMLIAVSSYTQQGMSSDHGLDDHMMKAAARDSKPTQGLETADEQVRFLSTLSRKDQLAMLEESIDESKDGPDEVKRLHDAWRNGDADGMWKEAGAKMRAQFPDAYRALIADRNARWMPKLAGMLDRPGEQDTMVVVGSLHLLGPDGLVAQLQKKGYTVERICSACGIAKPH